MSLGAAAPLDLRILDASQSSDRDAWLDLWQRWPEKEPAAHPGYLSAMSGPDESPMCASVDLGDGGVLLPFLLRPADPEDPEWTDITGPMVGYTGPFQWNVSAHVGSRFWQAFSAWARERRVVSMFARLSLFSDDLLPFEGPTRVVQPNVVRDLRLADEALWRDFEHKVRKNVKRAQAMGVMVESDPGCEHMDEFVSIYTDTMRRREATTNFFFDRKVFDGLIEHLSRSAQLFVARLDKVAVSAELVLTSSNHAYSFLGGTLASAFELRPNDLLKFEAIRTLRDQGLSHYVLGGGPQPGDSMFRYKRSFAPGGVVDFMVGERVFDQAAYDELVRRAAGRAARTGNAGPPQPGFFPTYRAPRLSTEAHAHT
ncbi:MAG: GNAT family N-acetyltransferase [Candidatus Dormibacteria bacterium]